LARLSPGARSWFLAEIAYLAERNPAAAEKIVAQLRATRQILADYPKAGAPGLIPGTRRFVMAPYVLTIRLRGEEVEISAIRHARQSDAYAPSADNSAT
jgi:plasmid stabilization system protein ParE